jgi:predicted ArsR family transcriptional regulator
MARLTAGTFGWVTDLRHTGVVKSAPTTSGAQPGVVGARSPEALTRQDDARTRDRVTQLLVDLGPSTAADLSQRLGLSPAGIRRHLDAMCASGAISAYTPPGAAYAQRGRGRPAKHYALTDAGHAAGPSAYDELATSALGFLAEQGGDDAISEFARRRAQELADRVSARLEALPDAATDAEGIAAALTAEGYAATVHPVSTGTQLCQHHCPVQAAAQQFPQLCDAETEALSKLLDTHVQRLATIAHGDGVCTTHVPARPAGSQHSPNDPHRKVSP